MQCNALQCSKLSGRKLKGCVQLVTHMKLVLTQHRVARPSAVVMFPHVEVVPEFACWVTVNVAVALEVVIHQSHPIGLLLLNCRSS
eukprot:m.120778 g.120778  ORF g.120778 m.120778 type:complete len:86 (-) comp9374_c0_seq1:2146-2403(-)